MRGRLLGNRAPDWIRTSDLQLRRLPLYPTELRARCSYFTAVSLSSPKDWKLAVGRGLGVFIERWPPEPGVAFRRDYCASMNCRASTVLTSQRRRSSGSDCRF